MPGRTTCVSDEAGSRPVWRRLRQFAAWCCAVWLTAAVCAAGTAEAAVRVAFSEELQKAFAANGRDAAAEQQRLEKDFNAGLGRLGASRPGAAALYASGQTIRIVCAGSAEAKAAGIRLGLSSAETRGDFDANGRPRNGGTAIVVIDCEKLARLGLDGRFFDIDPRSTGFAILVHELLHATDAARRHPPDSMELYNAFVDEFAAVVAGAGPGQKQAANVTPPSPSDRPSSRPAFPLHAQSQLYPWQVEVEVTDAQGEPLIGATILAADGKRGTFTGPAGSARLALPRPGCTTIAVSYTGYRTRTVEICPERGRTVGVAVVLEEVPPDPLENIVGGPVKTDFTLGGRVGVKDLSNFSFGAINGGGSVVTSDQTFTYSGPGFTAHGKLLPAVRETIPAELFRIDTSLLFGNMRDSLGPLGTNNRIQIYIQPNGGNQVVPGASPATDPTSRIFDLDYLNFNFDAAAGNRVNFDLGHVDILPFLGFRYTSIEQETDITYGNLAGPFLIDERIDLDAVTGSLGLRLDAVRPLDPPEGGVITAVVGGVVFRVNLNFVDAGHSYHTQQLPFFNETVTKDMQRTALTPELGLYGGLRFRLGGADGALKASAAYNQEPQVERRAGAGSRIEFRDSWSVRLDVGLGF